MISNPADRAGDPFVLVSIDLVKSFGVVILEQVEAPERQYGKHLQAPRLRRWSAEHMINHGALGKIPCIDLTYIAFCAIKRRLWSLPLRVQKDRRGISRLAQLAFEGKSVVEWSGPTKKTVKQGLVCVVPTRWP